MFLRSLMLAFVLMLSACEMASNAVSSSAEGFVSSQVDPVVSGAQGSISGAGSAAGSSAGGGY